MEHVEELRQQLTTVTAQMAALQQQQDGQPPPAVSQEMTDNMREMVAQIRQQNDTIAVLRSQAEETQRSQRDNAVRMQELRDVAARARDRNQIVGSKMLDSLLQAPGSLASILDPRLQTLDPGLVRLPLSENPSQQAVRTFVN